MHRVSSSLADRGPQPPDALADWCELTLTARCNQRCFFCYEDGRDIARDPPIEEVRRLLARAAERASKVVLCGKEVLLRPDVLDIVAHAHSLGLRVVVFTNGQALARRDLVADLARAGCSSLAISFHFPDPETFARATRTAAKGFHRALEGMRRVREHNLARPDLAMHVSTETDMFALNLGRLAEMRDTLRAALDGTGWIMRIGCLVPSPLQDIGLEHALEPIAARRAELERLLRTHPDALPLELVKVPLCMVPAGEEHRCLDVRYVREGTLLTSNHELAGLVTTDTHSTTAQRDLALRMRSHPYRWLCRPCPLAPLCRFDRVDWQQPFFHPTAEHRPEPRTGESAETLVRGLERLPASASALGALRAALASAPYPEERLLSALAGAAPGDPVLVGAYARHEPLLVVTLDRTGVRIELHIASVRRRGDRQRLGAIVSCFHVVASAPSGATPQDVRACLEALARAGVPGPEHWAGEPWFDEGIGRLLSLAWSTFARRIWPGTGGLGRWRTDAVELAPSGELCIELEHPTAARATLVCRLEGTGASPSPERLEAELRLVPTLAGPQAPWAEVLHLLATVGALVRAEPVPTPPLPEHAVRRGLAFVRLGPQGWRPQACEMPAGEIRFAIASATGEPETVFAVRPSSPTGPPGRRVGGLCVLARGTASGEIASRFERALATTARALRSVPPCPASVADWREGVSRVLARTGWDARTAWRAEWAPDPSDCGD
jgi:uncharacterized Fe-S cluster-containing radical SAM superfamily protein